MKELIIGAGSSKELRLALTPEKKEFENPTFLDNNASHNPDVMHDLRVHPLPFEANSFEEIHAYEVLEHLYEQGDYKSFFREFEEYHRILKPDGHMFITVPAWNSVWAWGDPSHTRVLAPETFAFLSQELYEDQVGTTAMSDFRHLYSADFKVVDNVMDENTTYVVLRAIK